ncbi:hypothetical protein BHE74_00027190 [Ensete ventricosum]|uniref:FAF domain-containing protein n=1 Tax=Ensete ventricosum TaxID=4639 RepID=A0A445MFT7_ENSVE|nr:hypothetical protein BHE74_00027190 [Ensete ventricosum]RZR73135.1 hypothetical protein BHM03_00020673 [Ensete ventricosum]
MQSSSTTFLLRRSRSLLSQESLEICTENLGSETGSEYFSSFMDDLDYRGPLHGFDDEKEEEKKDSEEKHLVVPEDGAEVSGVRRYQAKELKSVDYHRSTGRRSPLKSFPPPLPSISRRNGPCLHMRPHRRDGRLVVEAVLVPSQNYLHVQRVGGRLLLSFIDATSEDEPGYESETLQPHEQQDVDAKDDEATDITQLEVESEEKNCCEEEEVEVVDRGTVVEVKVSMQPQQQSGATKVHRSSLVINKFVGGTPLSDDDSTSNQNKHNHRVASAPSARRASPTATTAAAASTLSAATAGYNEHGHRRAMGTPLAAGKQAHMHIQAAEPPGAAAQHEEVQPAPEAAVRMGALLHCHFLLRPLASIPNHVQTLIMCGLICLPCSHQ